MAENMRLIIVSGLSGSGKSVALHVLEDLGYYCVDNMPAALLGAVVDEVRSGGDQTDHAEWRSESMRAIGAKDLDALPKHIAELQAGGLQADVLFLTGRRRCADEALQRVATPPSARRSRHRATHRNSNRAGVAV